MTGRDHVWQSPVGVVMPVLACAVLLVFAAGGRAAGVNDAQADCVRTGAPGLSTAPGSMHAVGDIQVVSLPSDSSLAEALQSDAASGIGLREERSL